MNSASLGWAALIITLLFGMLVGGYISNMTQAFKPMMAYGLDEKDNAWNRIRVDSKGHVICGKE